MSLLSWLFDLPTNLRQFLRCRRIHRRVSALADYPVYRPEEYRPRGETLFVLATGRSILELDDQRWEHIRRADSIALNLFVHSDFLPDVYLFEQIPDAQVRQAWLQRMPCYSGERPRLSLLPSYSLDLLRKLPGLGEMEKAIQEHLARSFRLVPVFFSRHRTPASLGFSRLLNRRFWRNGLYHLRGSLSSAVDFGLKQGFSEIVLCGVDLDDRGYFYGERHEKGEGAEGGKAVHFTNQEVEGLIGIESWLRYIVRREAGSRILCGSPSSRLASWMPVYDWSSRIREQKETQ